MSLPLKLLALLLAIGLHLPLFVLLDSGLQRGQLDAHSRNGRVAMTLAARPAAATAPAPAPAPAPQVKPAPKALPTATPALPIPAPPATTTAAPSSSVMPAISAREQRTEATRADNTDGSSAQRSSDAPGLGGSADEGKLDSERARYLGQLQAAIERLKRYPQQARLRRQQGTVTVRFSVAEDGRIRDLRIIQSSDSAILDHSVEQLFQRLRLPAPADELLPTLQGLTLPITFQLQTG